VEHFPHSPIFGWSSASKILSWRRYFLPVRTRQGISAYTLSSPVFPCREHSRSPLLSGRRFFPCRPFTQNWAVQRTQCPRLPHTCRVSNILLRGLPSGGVCQRKVGTFQGDSVCLAPLPPPPPPTTLLTVGTQFFPRCPKSEQPSRWLTPFPVVDAFPEFTDCFLDPFDGLMVLFRLSCLSNGDT